MIGIISGLLSALGWGTADFLAAKSSRKIGNVLTLFYMQIVGFCIALIYFLANLSSFNMNEIPKSIVLLIIIGFLQTIAYLAYYKGLEKGELSLVSPIGSSYVMIVVILAVIFLRESLKIPDVAAIILIILGIILVSINLKDAQMIKKLHMFAGAKQGLIAMLGWGISMFLIVPASKALGWFLPVFLFRLFGILFLSFYIFIKKQSLKTNSQHSLSVLILLVGVLDVVAFFSYSLGVAKEYTSIVAPVAACFPVVSIILARIFLKEKLALNQLFGVAAIIIGLVLISA